MTDLNEAQEDELMDRLRQVLDDADSGAEIRRMVAKSSFAWHGVDAELADLTFDAAVDEADLVMRSGPSAVRALSFATDTMSIDVELGDGRLIGHIVPMQQARVTLETTGGGPPTTVEADEMGVFVLDRLPTGTWSLTCVAADGSWTVRTAWMAA